jgi:hypothetical protein
MTAMISARFRICFTAVLCLAPSALRAQGLDLRIPSGAQAVQQANVELLAEIQESPDSVVSIVLFVNGKHIEDGVAPVPGEPRLRRLKFSAAPGENEVVAQVIRGDGAVQSAKARIVYRKPEVRPRLYLVALSHEGTGSKDRLLYADDDSEAIVRLFQESRAASYDMGSVAHLTAENCTRDKALEALREAGRRANENDVIIVFLSVHGGLQPKPDKDDPAKQQYVFWTRNYLRDGQGLSAQEIGAALAESKAGRILLIADACHSEAALNDALKASLEGLKQTRVNQARGFYGVAAATVQQEAIEAAPLGHGALTVLPDRRR